ncbi:MAG: V-type ATP synthase subunit I [Athalassotoga sp.]|uniref:V-type ATP synthase subunit I n=1 Tax=Athalassotoga sp. TaxID=2022597 RepID=UPI003CFE3E82
MAVSRMDNVTFVVPRERVEDNNLKIIEAASFEPHYVEEILDNEITSSLSKVQSENPYRQVYTEMMNFLKMSEYKPPFDEKEINLYEPIDIDSIEKKFKLMNEGIRNFFNRKNELTKQLKDYENVLFHVNILANLKIDLGDLSQINRIKLIFGRVPIRNYDNLIESSLKDPILILEVNRDRDNSWLFVFTSPDFEEAARKILQSAYFEEDTLPVDYTGTPKEVKSRIESLVEITKISINENDFAIKKVLYSNKEFIDKYYPIILGHKRVYDLHSFSSSTGSLYLLNGWMPSKEAKKFFEETEEDVLMINESAEKISKQKKIEVPVKVENRGGWLKGFEFVTKMFGIPSYGEIDPTPFVAAFFTFMFGFMLGDVGHGAILFLFGYFMYKKGSKQFGTVMMSAASASIFFGFMYGSVFGFEWLPAIWLRPIIQINQLMIVGIYYGIGMISFGMILNIINGFRQRNWEKAFFSPEGIAGLVFYWPAVIAVSFYLFEGKVPYMNLIIVLIIVSLIAMLLKKPLGQIVSGEKINLGEGFWVETGFGMFDTLISFLSNAISYVRLAAFALTHEALFEAFWIMTLMVLPARGGDVWAILIFLMGQLILVGLEGLVVFIQSLRLTYYEFFTKFFEAGGREFHPFTFSEEKRV